jgi:transcriptional regulator with XRE-family HTH domain
MKTDRIAKVDFDVGFRIRRLREKFGLSQGELADRIGVSFQQVQKYETGKNKVSLKRLCQISMVFNTTPSSFLQGIESQMGIKAPSRQAVRSLLPVLNSDEKRLLKLFRRIKSSKLRRVILLQLRAFRNLENNKHE